MINIVNIDKPCLSFVYILYEMLIFRRSVLSRKDSVALLELWFVGVSFIYTKLSDVTNKGF